MKTFNVSVYNHDGELVLSRFDSFRSIESVKIFVRDFLSKRYTGIFNVTITGEGVYKTFNIRVKYQG